MVRRRYRLQRSIQKTLSDLSSIALGKAPGFVYGAPVEGIPVFTYHVVDASFEEDLRWLERAGYRTVGYEELLAALDDPRASTGRAVALTFDDGHVSLTETAVPLLGRYGFRALAFVVSGLVPPCTERRLAGWHELREAVAGGALEVGAHSLHHHHVPRSDRVIGFVSPGSDVRFEADVPVARIDGGQDVPPGTPMLLGGPRYTVERAFRPDPRSWKACTDRAREEGATLFERPRWQAELERLLVVRGDYESAEESDAAVVADMVAAVERVERECPNPAARSL